MDLQKYLKCFEDKIILSSFGRGQGDIKVVQTIVPLSGGKWMQSELGEFIEKTFDSDFQLSINYYGAFKLSTGLISKVEKARQIFPNSVRAVKTNVMHFNSIKMEHIKKYAPELYDDYPEFKKHLVSLRWKKK